MPYPQDLVPETHATEQWFMLIALKVADPHPEATLVLSEIDEARIPMGDAHFVTPIPADAGQRDDLVAMLATELMGDAPQFRFVFAFVEDEKQPGCRLVEAAVAMVQADDAAAHV